MAPAPRRVVYCSWSPFKKEEWATAKDHATLSGSGKKLGELFEFEFRDVETTEPLLCDLEAMVRFKVASAYRSVQVPCIVEHAGLILEGYEAKSYPGGLTQPMWDSLGAENFVACCSKLSTKTIARAVIGYCDGLNTYTFVGETKGMLVDTPRGEREFYWDTVFCPDGFSGKTYAEIVGKDRKGMIEKLKVSQSIRALEKFMEHRIKNEPSLFPAL